MDSNQPTTQRYFMTGPDGNKYGPVELSVLNQWAQEGRLIGSTIIEYEGSARRVFANELPGLNLPQPATPTAGPAAGPAAAANPMGVGYPREIPGDIPNHMVKSIVCLLCCSIIFGLIPLFQSIAVNNHIKTGNYNLAREASDKANRYGNNILIIFGILNLLWVFASVLLPLMSGGRP